MKDLLVLLGKRVHELRVAKKWSQEEFAHVSGLHRTYIGQIERGEKNISFANLIKVSGVLGVSLSELLAGLETGSQFQLSKRPPDSGERQAARWSRTALDVQKLIRRLAVQRAAMDRSLALLEQLIAPPRPAGRSAAQRNSRAKR